MGVDLPEIFFYEKVLFFTQLSYHLMCKLLKKSYMLSSKQVPENDPSLESTYPQIYPPPQRPFQQNPRAIPRKNLPTNLIKGYLSIVDSRTPNSR